MNKFLIIALALFSATAQAAISTGDKYLLNNRMGGVAYQTGLGTLIDSAQVINASDSTLQAGTGAFLKRLIRVDYNPQLSDTGTTVAGNTMGHPGPHSTGVVLPPASMITSAWFYSQSVLTSVAERAFLKMYCSGTAASPDIMIERRVGVNLDTSSVVNLINGSSTLAVSANSACTITVHPTKSLITGGKLLLFLEYVVAQQ